MDTESNRQTLNIAEASESQPRLDAKSNFPSLNWGEPKPLITDPIPVLRGGKGSPCTTPILTKSPGALGLSVPSPISTKRTRTNATYDRAMENPIERGYIKYFSRAKGHGFIKSYKTGTEIFVHISDIEGEYVPRQDDKVSFRLCPIPPKLEKFQAIHVRIINFTPEVHLKWDSPLYEDEKDEKLEDLRLRLNEPIVPLTNEAILHLSTELQPLYKALIMYNLDEFIARNLETALWNDCFKTPLTRYGRTDKNLFNLMIESGVGFYLSLIQDIGVHFDISFITNTPSATKLYCTSPIMNNHFIKPSKSSIYFIIQNCLLHVGDLLRYRGSSYAEAIKMYEKSAAVCPSNGYPYHQMGLTQLLIATTSAEDETVMDGLLSCFYYFARSLAVSNRYLPAFQSIENLVKTKVEAITKKLPKTQEMLRIFMISIYENTKAVNLSQLMGPIVANHEVSASTLVKMIVIALWNNWRNQFSVGSLDIVASIFNSIVFAITSVLGVGEVQQHYTFCLPHLKLLMEWINWHQDNAAIPYLYTQINIGALVNVLNHLRMNNTFAQNAPNSWVLEAILPEEKKLIGFIPLDYSVCFNAGSSAGAIEPPKSGSAPLNANPPRQAILGGHLLSEDKDIALSFNLRIHRIVSVALKMASNKSCFMYDGSNFMEMALTPTSSNAVPTQLQPSRRNVALQSIFRTANGNLDTGTDNQQHQDLVSPSSCGSAMITNSSNIANNLSSLVSSSTTPSLSTSSLTTSHDFFRSIWTPDTENTDSNWN